MVSDNFYQGFMGQSVSNANREIERANIKIRELRDLRRQDAAELAEVKRKLEAAEAEIKRSGRIIDTWNSHYVAIEAQCGYLLGLLDKAFGEGKNPARRDAYAPDVDELIPTGPRKGQRVTMRDHIYFARLAELTKGTFKHLGDWKALLREANYFE